MPTDLNTACDIHDPDLAEKGALRTEWAEQNMPVLRQIRERFSRERPLEGVRLSACLHVTSETASLMRTLAAGGADAVLCASIFHYGEHRVREAKRHLAAAGIPVRA